MAKTTNLFLTKGASVSDMKEALPKEVVTCGFVINEEKKIIEYVGVPKALKFVIPVMVSVVESLDKTSGFSVIRTPKTYTDKTGQIKTTNIVTISYKKLDLARILVENVNNLCRHNYEQYKLNNANKAKNQKSK